MVDVDRRIPPPTPPASAASPPAPPPPPPLPPSPPPSSPGFPDSRSLPALQSLFHLPSLSLSIQLFAGPTTATWPTSSWSPRPARPQPRHRHRPLQPKAVPAPHPTLRPLLPPLPSFTRRQPRLLRRRLPRFLLCKNPRWIEFWTDVADSSSSAASRRRKSSSTSCSSSRISCSSSTTTTSNDTGPDPESFVEIRPAAVRRWVGNYMKEIVGVLREGGWRDEEVEEIVHVSAACSGLEECEGIIGEVGGGHEGGEVGGGHEESGGGGRALGVGFFWEQDDEEEEEGGEVTAGDSE